MVAPDIDDAPSVSITMATRRPSFLHWAIDNVARQNYPNLELVLALHGDGFEKQQVDDAVAGLPHRVSTVLVPGEVTLGDVLNAAVAEASGELLAKMDDDDLYGADYIWDLVLAHRRSGATVVGKGAQTVYLHESNQTIRRSGLGGHTYARTVSGNTIMISRLDLERFGGWPPVRAGEDSALVDQVVASGEGVFRAGGEGHLIVRHGVAHTMKRQEGYFLERSQEALPGWCPSLAGIRELPDQPHFPAPERRD